MLPASGLGVVRCGLRRRSHCRARQAEAGQMGVVAQHAGTPAGTFADRPDGGRRNGEQGHRRRAGHRREQGRALADPLREGGTVGDREGAAARRQPWREEHAGAGGVARTGDRGDDADGAGGRHALVVPVDGAAPGHDTQLRQSGVAVARPQAAPDPDLQAEQRPALRGEAAGRGGALPRPAGQRGGCSASTRRAGSRRWTGRSRACR